MSRLFQLLMLALVLGTSAASAESVSVNRGNGLGYTFTHRGNCYLILPAHVHGRQTRLSLLSTAPSSVGDAQVFFTFAPETDLSVAYVTNGLEDNCSAAFRDFPTDLKPVLDRTTAAQLVRVDAAGVETRDDMVITGVDFTTITARVADGGRAAEIYKGTSGAMLKAGDVLLGMAIQSEDTSQAVFLRADEIASRLARLLESGPAPALAVSDAAPAPSACPAGALKIMAVECSAEPTAPEYACSNLLGGGPVIFPPEAEHPRIVLQFAGEPQTPGSVTLYSSAEDGVTAAPKSVLVESSSSSGTPRWRRFGSGDMSPVGRLVVSNGARPFANRLAITLTTSWNAALPTRLDCIAAN